MYWVLTTFGVKTTNDLYTYYFFLYIYIIYTYV